MKTKHLLLTVCIVALFSVDLAYARWPTIDRYAEKYPSVSPYSYAAGNPIRYIDINGDSLWIAHKGNNYLYENGKLFLNGEEYTGKIRGFLKQTVNALNNVGAGGGYGSTLTGILQQSGHNYTIVRANSNGFVANNISQAMANTQEYKNSTGNSLGSQGTGGEIRWNPNSTTSGFNTAGNTNRPAFIGLAHEMQHAADANFGILHGDNYTNPATGAIYNPTHEGLNRREWRAIYLENQIRGHYGIPLRTHYGINNGTYTGPRLIDALGIPRLF